MNKWVKAPAEVEPRYRREAAAGKLSAFHEALIQPLRVDALAPSTSGGQPAPLQQLRRCPLRQAGGDRVMAQVPAIVPAVGVEAVLVAVELALESGPPSGRVRRPTAKPPLQSCVPLPITKSWEAIERRDRRVVNASARLPM
ncbi:MAG: hypothetical protein EOO27_39795 [Comamonadaceae bacterium]|nr:MAG: hypothetical protein EOO27_39795 [Comamonadaceae bacterium]